VFAVTMGIEPLGSNKSGNTRLIALGVPPFMQSPFEVIAPIFGDRPTFCDRPPTITMW